MGACDWPETPPQPEEIIQRWNNDASRRYYRQTRHEEPSRLPEHPSPNNPSNGNQSTSVDSVNLSNSSSLNDATSSSVETAEAESESGVTEDSKKIGRKNKSHGGHIETIQPDINIPSGSNTGIPKKRRAKLIQKPKLTKDEKEPNDVSIRTLRKQELLTVKKEDIEKIYEQKNYAYLRAEDMKKLRLFPRPRPPITEPDTPVEKP